MPCASTDNLPPHFLNSGAPVDVGNGTGRGGIVALASLGLRWGRAAEALACAACSRPRAKVVGGQRRSQAHPRTFAVATALAEGGAAALALLGSRWVWAADVLACAARLPEVRGGQ